MHSLGERPAPALREDVVVSDSVRATAADATSKASMHTGMHQHNIRAVGSHAAWQCARRAHIQVRSDELIDLIKVQIIIAVNFNRCHYASTMAATRSETQAPRCSPSESCLADLSGCSTLMSQMSAATLRPNKVEREDLRNGPRPLRRISKQQG